MSDDKSSLEKYGILNFSPAIPNVSEEILKVSGSQVPYFRIDFFAELMRENENILLELVESKESRVIFLTASGTGAMDAAVSNLISSQDKVLVINGGSFGKRWKDICDFYSIDSYEFKIEFGKRINLVELEKTIREINPSIILVQHVETSSGQKHDLASIGSLSKNYGIYLIVDAISSFANEEFKMDEWGVDATLISSQKGLGLFPGTSVVVLGKRILSKPFSKRNFYFDFSKYLGTVGDMVLPFTPNVNSLMQWNARLKQVKQEGIKTKIEKVNKQAEHFRSLVKILPVEIAAQDPSNCVTCLYTQRNDIKDFFKAMQKKKIYFSPQGGEGSQLVVTHMGDVTLHDNLVFFEELKKWINNFPKKVVFTSGTWDLFHKGHLNVLKKSKELGDVLIVAVSTDELVHSYKKTNPIMPFEDRVEMVKACKYADIVVPQHILTDINDLIRYGVNVITIGSDWKDKTLEGLDWAKQNGIEVVYLPYTKGVSTSSIAKGIIERSYEIIGAQFERGVAKLY